MAGVLLSVVLLFFLIEGNPRIRQVINHEAQSNRQNIGNSRGNMVVRNKRMEDGIING